VDLKLPHTPSWENLTQSEALQLLKAAEPHVDWTYTKSYEVRAEQFNSLQERVHAAVDNLHTMEKGFVHNLLKLPEGASVYWGSFAEKTDPRRTEYGPREVLVLDVHMPYKSLEEAFADDIRKITGYLKLTDGIRDDGSFQIRHWGDIDVYMTKDGYNAHCIGWTGPHSELWRLPVKYQNKSIENLRAFFSAVAGLFPEKHHIKV
jgi:hypothetical protein